MEPAKAAGARTSLKTDPHSPTVKSGLERAASSRIRVKKLTQHTHRFRFDLSRSAHFRQFFGEIEVGGSSGGDSSGSTAECQILDCRLNKD
jgi:hypothetical protein